MNNYVTASLENHLFFARIMKEHSLFLLAGFPAGETELRNKADWFRAEFEKALERAVVLADGAVKEEVLNSGEVITEYTETAERQTAHLSGIPIETRITQAENKLRAGKNINPSRQMVLQVRNLNQRIVRLLNGLIVLKERILREVTSCSLYTTNYPLLIEHILREARLYRQIIQELERKGHITVQNLREVERFWNQIMMEHAQFIRGLLDPTECELIDTADQFAGDYCRLLEEAKQQDCRAANESAENILETTEKYRDFKAAGTKGIIDCDIRSVILPLLADHVLREANHYLRILKSGKR